MADGRYPEVEALDSILERAALRLSIDTGEPSPSLAGRRRICLESPGQPPLVISVDDEYEDASDGNPALLLHLVLSECELWEETDGVGAWAAESGLNASEAGVRDLFVELTAVVPRIRSAVGSARALSSWDVQLGAGAAEALRARSRRVE